LVQVLGAADKKLASKQTQMLEPFAF
jgi:hypothetical protein